MPSRRWFRWLSGAVVLAAASVALHVLAAQAAVGQEVGDPNGETEAAAQALADRFAPVIMLRLPSGECEGDGERYRPMSVEAVLSNSQVLLRQVGAQNPVVARGPSASDVHGMGGGFFLDFPGNALTPGCLYEQDYHRYVADGSTTVYAHIVRDGDVLALQYWFFWYYNDWNNKHEGDWEGIQLLFDAGSVEEALETDPTSVGYAQHEGGERADWDDDKLERRGDRPVVYPSVGSHASYFGSALYLGRSGSEGFGCDTTVDATTAVDPEVVVLPHSAEGPDSTHAWLGFDGHWGELQSGPFNGPTGPQAKDRWVEPVAWHEELRSTSVQVPGGDQVGGSVINSFCGVVEWGSAQTIAMKTNPARLFATAALGAVLVGVALRRTDWSAVAPLPVVRRRRAGQILRASWALFVSRPGPFVVIGLAYLPIALLAGLGTAVAERLPVVGPLIESDGDLGVMGVLTTLAVGSVGHAAAFAFVTAAVAHHLTDREEAGEAGGRAALVAASAQLGTLITQFTKALLVIAVLFATVVGIPWGIRQIIRYQFMPPVVAREPARRQRALKRSAELVRGRWFHTAGVVAVANGLVAAVVLVVGLILLLLLTGMPLWAFSALVTAGAAAVAPIAAIATVLLYGDATAASGAVEPIAPAENAQLR